MGNAQLTAEVRLLRVAIALHVHCPSGPQSLSSVLACPVLDAGTPERSCLYFLLFHFLGMLSTPPLLCFLGMLLVLCSQGESSRKPAAGRLRKLIAWGRVVLTRLEPSMLLSPTFGMVSHCNPRGAAASAARRKE